jgi:S-adenosylmethionine-diacylglycerol 3-amino-3-carboxypropyl transferase
MANELLATGTSTARPANLADVPDFRAGRQTASRNAALRTHCSIIRYAQCWEDADILLEALNIQPAHVCLSIASAGDNTLAMLSKGPQRVIAIDLNPAQLSCLELRVAAFRELEHDELLELIGSRASTRREHLYRRCRPLLTPMARLFWDARPELILGIGHLGKFERYLADFRRWVLPLLHSREMVERVIELATPAEREEFYRDEWDTTLWRVAFRIFFSRSVMQRLGRDARCFRFADGGLAAGLLERTRHAMTMLDPAANPYAQWILFGRHVSALPYALRPENFDAIRANLDRLELRCMPVQEFTALHARFGIDRFNLSDVFEYMSQENYERVLESISACARPGARLAYWNLLAARQRPESMAGRIRPLNELAERLHREDKTFFYSAFVVEEVL